MRWTIIKILIFSVGKYGDRAIKVVQKKFPSAEFLIIREENPTIVSEISMHQKPTILPVHFGEVYFNQINVSNAKVVRGMWTNVC